jgi:uncharacterized protein YjbI with pentapeptide repeats
MRWLKRDICKAGIAIAGMLLLLVLMVWVPVSAAGAYERASGLATPTVDPTMTALQKEQLAQQVDKLKQDNAWAWLSFLSALGPIATIAAGLLAALYSVTTWIRNRQDEQEKRAEERFQSVVEGLGSERTEAKVGAAIMLRTFLQPGYEQFYSQAFDLAVAHLRLRKADASAPGPLSSPAQVLIVPKGSLFQEQQPPPSTTSIPLDSLSQALITVFKESFRLARKGLQKPNAQFDPQLLDATNVRLDNAYLVGADLVQAWLVRASLREADLRLAQLNDAHLSKAQLQGAHLDQAQLQGAHLNQAQLQGAHLDQAQLQGAHLDQAQLQGAVLIAAHLDQAQLQEAQLQGAHLNWAQLQEANLNWAQLQEANLDHAQLQGAILTAAQLQGAQLEYAQLQGAHLGFAQLQGANFSIAQLQGAHLNGAKLQGAQLQGADLQGADLRGAQLEGADLRGAQLEGANLWRAQLEGANPEEADSLKDTKMNGVIGLTPEQREMCIQKGAIFDVQQAPASATSSSSSLSPAQSNDAQALSAPSVQESTQTPSVDGSSASPPSQSGS